MRIEEMSSVDFAKAVKKGPVVILPFGAVEAHGEHLPLGTDSFQPMYVADEVARRIGGLVAPIVAYGQHSSTRRMPGTLGIRMETLKAVAIDVVSSLYDQGIRKVVILTGHAGTVHMAALKSAGEELVWKYEDLQLMVLSDYDYAFKMKDELCGEEDDGHGGIIETSRVLALRPELVKKKRRRGCATSPNFMVVRHPERFYPDCFVGDAAKASAEKGKKVNDFVVEKLTAAIKMNFGV
ncbi:MAG: creatininase family protein [Methanomassiliicoccales archaeon]|nr:MAG: creatininase family protein [Methanomassiliicoccales archaeon]